MDQSDIAVIKQHLIDPEICIRCNTCEATCPVGAITHDSRNYVVDADEVQSLHGVHPALSDRQHRQLAHRAARAGLQRRGAVRLGRAAGGAEPRRARVGRRRGRRAGGDRAGSRRRCPRPRRARSRFARMPSARRCRRGPRRTPTPTCTGPKAADRSITATVAGNVRVTEVGREYDTHHIVLDFGADAVPGARGSEHRHRPAGHGRATAARIIRGSIRSRVRATASGPGYNNLSLTIKRVLEDHQGRPVRGVASNYMCDLKVGDKVEVTGPFGASFLMPNHPKSHIVMICTGTGSAPMRAMTEWRRRLRATGKFEGGKLMLFFGARTKEELPYFGPLQSLPKDFIDINLALQPHAGAAEALRAGPDARARRRRRPAARRCRTRTSTCAA